MYFTEPSGVVQHQDAVPEPTHDGNKEQPGAEEGVAFEPTQPNKVDQAAENVYLQGVSRVVIQRNAQIESLIRNYENVRPLSRVAEPQPDTRENFHQRCSKRATKRTERFHYQRLHCIQCNRYFASTNLTDDGESVYCSSRCFHLHE